MFTSSLGIYQVASQKGIKPFKQIVVLTIYWVEEKFGEQNFRVLSEMRILGKIRVVILDFGRVSLFF